MFCHLVEVLGYVVYETICARLEWHLEALSMKYRDCLLLECSLGGNRLWIHLHGKSVHQENSRMWLFGVTGGRLLKLPAPEWHSQRRSVYILEFFNPELLISSNCVAAGACALD